MNFKKVKIKDLVNLINGYSFKSEDWSSEGKKIIRIQNLNNSEAEYNRTTKNVPEKFIVNKGDILIAWAGSLGVYEWHNEEAALLNQHLFKVEFKTNEIDKIYFKYVIYQSLKELEKKARGVGLKHLNKGQINEYEFNLPDINSQIKATSILGKIESLILTRQSTKLLNEEYQTSLFYTMFGDSIINTFNWPQIKLKEATFLISDGTHRTPKYIEDGVIFLSAKNINKNTIDWQNVKYIQETEYASLLTRGNPEKGDILLTKSGSLGRSAVLEKDIKFSFYESIALIKCNKDILNPYFFVSLLRSNAIQYILNDRKKGVAVKHLHLKVLRDLDIILPPIERQNQFEIIYKQVQVLSDKIDDSLKLLNELLEAFVYNTFNPKKPKEKDEIDTLIHDDIQLELFLNTINASDFENDEQYDIAIKKLYRILERTSSINLSNEENLKGIIQRMESDTIILETNKEYKYRLKDEAIKN
ncbi:restriction endonuclease subunit S [Leeuwenhoekiella sp. A2]|uniref:restriction endonuclease subunit S n=1 Tax=Leeuwenhoekiella sp. A2 TaxID=3141460 RepID=UPI003A806996